MRPVSAVREFALGIGMFFRGFALWRRRPRLALLGLVPALIVGVGFTVLIVLLAVGSPAIATFLTPFAEMWEPGLRAVIRLLIVVVLLSGAGAAAALLFTSVTLVVGDPFYERIWRAVESELGAPERLEGPPLSRVIADAAVLAVRGAFLGIVLLVVGVIPGVGPAAGTVLGAWIGGLGLVEELVARPLEARGFDRRARAVLLRRSRARTLGFGIAAYVVFLIPGGTIVGMGPAVAGATALARDLLPPAPATSEP